jgi:thiol-disulfide isomerase/thioredoxin
MKAKRSCIILVLVLSACVLAGGRQSVTVSEWITPNPPSSSDLSGRVYVIEFWATWCGPCITSIPHINQLYRTYREYGVEFISLAEQSVPDTVRKMVRKHRISYHVGVDLDTITSFRIDGYPTAVVIDHKGTAFWQGHPMDPDFEKAIREAVSKAPPPILCGLDLGPFTHFRAHLWGGSGFIEAYRHISNQMGSGRDEHSLKARSIIDAIDNGIARKIGDANEMRHKDPIGAYRVYADVIQRYGGISAADPALSPYLELKKRFLPGG